MAAPASFSWFRGEVHLDVLLGVVLLAAAYTWAAAGLLRGLRGAAGRADRSAARSQRLLPVLRAHGAAPRADARRGAALAGRHARLHARRAGGARRARAGSRARAAMADAPAAGLRRLRRGARGLAPARPLQRRARN